MPTPGSHCGEVLLYSHWSEMNVYSKGQQSAGRLKIYLNENNLAFCYYKSDTVPVH